ncbi:Ketopantoate reductase PanE/ApbA [Streptosporangium canum]|uniref:Ketopantoate reductase PanE/ApbA n=1 Tax=Streptosporangium canum TaxID=324952 RepID=A0A1I3Z8R2_9ACTN|nr:2-dehydropantoate 2-reductase N-terminal domain-containing protein [Streptosporangium canum]SFK40290.1 Ketopantoate reductase PanE/ApbA [Streptosporangium canum]
MRYIVVGAGAVGGTIGGRLSQGGHDVVLVARGAHYDALSRDGLRLVTPDSAETLDIPVAREPVRLRDDDVLIGRELGIPAPANEVLRREANRSAREQLPPGSMSPRALTELIDAHAAAVSG